VNVLISGASGFIGSAVAARLTEDGHRVSRLLRPGGRRREGDVSWDPLAGQIDADALEGHEAVIHLAGEPIAGRWTAAKKDRIRDSRVAGTALLSEALAKLDRPPAVLIAASATGYYGSASGDREPFTEDDPPGGGFLAGLCTDWEAATAPAARAGVRVANIRISLVLAPDGGALKRMLPVFRFGLGGRIGSGRQYWSWISLHDAAAAVLHVLRTESLSGPVNLASPNAATNSQFTKALGRALGRWTFMPLPAFAARLMFGEMADELLLSSARVEPRKLAESGFRFTDADLEATLRKLL